MKPSNRVFYLPYELYVEFIHEGKLKNHKLGFNLTRLKESPLNKK